MISLLLITGCILLISCSSKNQDNGYDDNMYQFYNQYFEIAEVINQVNAKDIIILREQKNLEKIKELSELLTKLKDDIPDDRQSNYTKLQKWYKELMILSNEKYSDWWGVTLDERREAHTLVAIIRMRLSDWEDEEGTTVWEQ